MTGVGDDSRGRLAGRPWLVVGLVLAVGATLALVLSDDLRYLRLGIVAALWAALIGAFLAVRYRKHVSQSEDAVAEAQAVYELELEREIAARREFELEIEAETRQAAESRSQEELEALRAEVSALRESLQSLFGGEVLLERVALTAQATRMRSLDNKQLMSAGSENGNGKPQLMAAKSTTIDVDERERERERPTEMIDRVLEPASARAGTPPAARRKPANGQVNGTNGYGQSNQVQRPKPVDESTRRSMRKADARASKAAEALAAEAARRERLEMSNPGMSPAEVSRPMPRVDAQRKTPPPVTPAEVSRPSMPGVSRAEVSQPSMPTIARQPQRPEPPRNEPPRRPQQSSLQQRLDAGTVQRPPAARPEEQTRKQTPPVKPPVQAKPVKKVEPDRPRPNRELGLTRPGMKPVERSRPAGGTPPPANKPVTPEPMEATGEWKPSWTQERPVSDLSAAFPRKDDFQDRLRPTPPAKPQPAAAQPRPEPRPEPRREPEPPTPPSIPAVSEPPRRAEPVRQPEPEPVRRPAAEAPSRHSSPPAEEPPAVNPTLPEEIRLAQSGGGGRRRRAAEDSSVSITPAPNVPEPTGGGRRRRPDGEPPAWQSAAAESTGGRHGGRRAKPDDETPSRNGSSHSRPETSDAGSHASGRSVMDLLAANGANESTPRRRRRAED
ncbi:DUF6779 domain-containing protein [Amycolatopsis keratiniphila]|uniref:DUF6779 domain-containing protein n=1 Tax=Amycolatopsis keratiniphila TaxID=129921 RepID=UPI0009078E55|nr:DUF6779 domain-containing protein [Amycolatopsis keratiniphila]OLZ52255.1 hypothetical protein BS330_27015 [Amycolatopsis keratiniphila subsp. nogabecina]